MKRDPQKWLEMAVAVDPSVVSFHGRRTVKRYVLTLLNMVSAIYADPTLGSHLQFVVSRLVIIDGYAMDAVWMWALVGAMIPKWSCCPRIPL